MSVVMDVLTREEWGEDLEGVKSGTLEEGEGGTSAALGRGLLLRETTTAVAETVRAERGQGTVRLAWSGGGVKK